MAEQLNENGLNPETHFATEMCQIEYHTSVDTVNSIIRQAQEKLFPEQWNEVSKTPLIQTNGIFDYDVFVNRENNRQVEICVVPSEGTLNNFIAGVLLGCELNKRGVKFCNTDHGAVLKDVSTKQFIEWIHGPECTNEPSIVIKNTNLTVMEKPNWML